MDPHIESHFHDDPGFSAHKTGPLRGRNTTLAITLTPVVFDVTGLVKHSSHAQNTGMLAAEAIADTQIISFVAKHAIGRLIPSDIPAHGDLRDTWFKYKAPSPMAAVFLRAIPRPHSPVASVVATRYREQRWVPWVAYAVATGLSLTRLPDQAHFPSDIFIGAALGYGIGHFVGLHR